MRVLAVNTGSSSLKLRLLGPGDELLAAADVDRWDGQDRPAELLEFTGSRNDIDVVGHRVVHGGPRLRSATLIDAGVRREIASLTTMAPLHQPRAVAAIDALAELLPEVPAVACFDTSFHASIPAPAATYALPAAWREGFGLRRYGFHGLSHAYAARRGAELLGTSPGRLRMITCHLGAGCSLAAVRYGRCADTTMGFTPLEGLVMATRPGNTDPGMLIWLLTDGGLEVAEVADGLLHGSGLAGLAGGSGDMRDVLDRAAAGDASARLALDVYGHRLRQQVAGMAAAMDGVDAVVFTGGVGEHVPAVRAGAVPGFLHAAVDPGRNEAARGDADITADGSPVSTLVVSAREDIEIAREVRGLLSPPGTGAAPAAVRAQP